MVRTPPVNVMSSRHGTQATFLIGGLLAANAAAWSWAAWKRAARQMPG